MNNYVFKKQLINGKWYSVCINHEHVPLVEYCKDSTYKVVGSDGKPRLEKEYKAAEKFAIETYKKMIRYNKKWDLINS